jgi:hypothetical protein
MLEYILVNLTVITAIISFFFILICMFDLLKKFKINVKYEFLFQYFMFKLFYSITSIVSTLMLDFLADDTIHIQASYFRCILEHYISDFSESCSSFILFIIWIYLMWERKLVGSTKEISQNINNESNKIKNLILRYKRFLILGTYYLINLLITIKFFSNDMDKYDIIKYKSCATNNSTIRKFITIHTLPTAILIFIFSTFFWRLFGGSQDMFIQNMDEQTTERNLVKFIKLLSLIDVLELVFTIIYVIAASINSLKYGYFYATGIRFIEILCIVLTSIFYLYFENQIYFQKLKDFILNIFNRRRLNNNTNDSISLIQNETI